MSKKILFLVEGSLMEKEIISNISKSIFNLLDNEYEVLSYNTSIYEFYDLVKLDADLDLIDFLLEKNVLTEYINFSQKFLIFDFEPHYQKYDDKKIKDMLCFFNNETEQGKLYINYPMVEAAFHTSTDSTINNYPIIDLEGFNGDDYKSSVKSITYFKKKNNVNFKLDNYEHIKVSFLVNLYRYCNIIELDSSDAKNLLKLDCIDCDNLLEFQIKMKNSDNKIYVISTMILIIFDFNLDVVKKFLSM